MMLQDFILHADLVLFWFFANMHFNFNIASVFVLHKRHGFIMLNADYPVLPICS